MNCSSSFVVGEVMHRQDVVQPTLRDRPSTLPKQQQVLVRRMRLHAPDYTVLHQHNRLSAAASALQDLHIRPFTPLQQPSADTASSPASFHIPPVPEWGQDDFLMAGCEAHAAPLRVAVLVSGGVDSSLALQLVAAAGHKPTAFYLQIWFQEDFRNFWDSCPWEEDLDYARKVCDSLGVPLVVVPLTQQYWERVVSHSVAEIKAGRTPNPDMLCNSRVKFGAFVEYLETEHAGQFDRIASGHYARMVAQEQHQQQQQQQHQQHKEQQQPSLLSALSVPADTAQQADRLASHSQAGSSSGSGQHGGARYLSLTPDAVKDQTYFLANLSAVQLLRCMFPLGGFTKPQVRALATAAGLATSGRKDSQGICFLGKVKFAEFVKEYLGEWPGPLVEEDSGKVVGIHSGYWFYTVGQRGGIKLPGGPWYVTAKDMTQNIVYVSRSYYEADKRRDAFVCGPFNWLSELRPQPDRTLFVKVRHGPNIMQCQLLVGPQPEMLTKITSGAGTAPVQAAEDQSTVHPLQQQQQQFSTSFTATRGVSLQTSQLYGMVVLSENDQGLAAGQYAVFYQDGLCLGSAQMLGTVAS